MNFRIWVALVLPLIVNLGHDVMAEETTVEFETTTEIPAITNADGLSLSQPVIKLSFKIDMPSGDMLLATKTLEKKPLLPLSPFTTPTGRFGVDLFCTGATRDRSSHFHIQAPTTKGLWKKNIVWRPRWVKTWKEKKIYVAVWKKMWGPVFVNEYLPVPRPPPGWIKHKHRVYIKNIPIR